jgi:hypothetical protein
MSLASRTPLLLLLLLLPPCCCRSAVEARWNVPGAKPSALWGWLPVLWLLPRDPAGLLLLLLLLLLAASVAVSTGSCSPSLLQRAAETLDPSCLL